MRPKAVPVLTGKDAERFEEQDKKPLEKEQKDFLAECLALYKNNPIRKQVVFLSDDKISLEDLEIFPYSRELFNETFDCTDGDTMGLNDFYHYEAFDYQDEKLGITYVFTYNSKTVGYATVAMSKIVRDEIKRRFRPPIGLKDYPALLIGRLAVDNKWRRKGIGTEICKWCIGRALALSDEIGCRYVVLQTDEDHKAFYEKAGFTLFKEEENRKGTTDCWFFYKIDI